MEATNINVLDWDSLIDFRKQLEQGAISLDEFKAIFEDIVENKEQIKASLNKAFTIKAIKRIIYVYHDQKKAELIDKLYDTAFLQTFNMLDVHVSFVMFQEECPKLENVIRDSFKDLTQQHLIDYSEDKKKEAIKKEKENEETLKAIQDPQTYNDFVIWFNSGSTCADFTPVQYELWDQLKTDHGIEQQEKEEQRNNVVRSQKLENMSVSLEQTVHSKKGHDVFVVVLSERIDKDAYKELVSKCKQLGGYYSSYSRDNAIPGYQFKTEDSAKSFMSLIAGNDQEKQSIEKASPADKLLDMAAKMLLDGEASLNQDRRTNTHRQASQAGYAEQNARELIEQANTIKNLAIAIDQGQTKYLNKVQYRVDVQTLNQQLRKGMFERIRNERDEIRYGKEDKTVKYSDIALCTFPYMYLDRSVSQYFIDNLRKIEGCTMLAKSLVKCFNSRNNKKLDRLTFHVHDGSLMYKIIQKLKSDKENWYGLGMVEQFDTIKRLERLGIANNSELRTVLREYFNLLGDKIEQDPIQALERDLIGRKIPGFFPTPKTVIDIMIDKITVEPRAGLNQADKVLEPSAGKGDIADALKELYNDVSVIECSSILRDLLETKGHNLIDRDCLQHTEKYDKIVMNPPFEAGQDREHIQYLYDNCLNPGGRLVAVMANGSTWTSENKACSEFRDWLSDKGYKEELPEQSFKDAFRSTGVNVCLVVIDK